MPVGRSFNVGCQMSCYKRANKKPRQYGGTLCLLLCSAVYCGSPTRARTWNTLINSQVLYH